MLLLTSILVIMADLTVSPILPKIKETFVDIPNIDLLVKMVLTMPALFIVISSPFIGCLLDKYGRKKIILISILTYIIAGSSGYFVDSIYELLTGRAILGIATAGVITGCSALVGDYYEGEEVSNMMGLQSTFIGYGGLLCLFLGGFLGDISWRATFLVYLLPVILLFLFAKFIDEPCGQECSHYTTLPQKSTCQKKLNLGIKDNKFLKKLIALYIIAFGTMIFFYMVPLQLPFYLKSIMPISNTKIGLTIAIMPLFSATTAIFYKKLRRHFAYRSIFVISCFTMGLGFTVISLFPEYIFSAIGLVFIGMAMGMVVPNLRAWIGSCSDSAFLGRAFGGLTASIYLGQFFSPFVINQVIKLSSIPASFTIAGISLLAVSLVFIFAKIR